MADNKINWFPGHMKKAIDEIKNIIKNIDVIIEVLDARCIKSSSNTDLIKFYNNKIHLKVALKSDLAGLVYSEDQNLIISNIFDKNLRSKIINKLLFLLKMKIDKYKQKGLVNPKFSILVCGLPNIGKSSLINLLNVKKVVEARNIPGVTKTQRRVNIHNYLDVIDTPGIFIKNITDLNTAYQLSIINCINFNVLPIDKVLEYGFDFIAKNHNKSLLDYYKINEYSDFNNFINKIKDKFLSKNNQIDFNKLYMKLFKDLSESKICKIKFN